MVQMSAKDQLVVKALPGNSVCCDCGMKNPQWASVSFGNVFCLECSGVHRFVGQAVHWQLLGGPVIVPFLSPPWVVVVAVAVYVGRWGCTLALSVASPWTAGPNRSSTS